MKTNVKKKVFEGIVTGAGFTPYKVSAIEKAAKASRLGEILSRSVEGFVRLEVKMDECRMAESKKGKMRMVILIAQGGARNGRLHQCYLAATRKMFAHYKLGDNPYVETPREPVEYRNRYTAVYNHLKELHPTMVSRYLEFIHTQAELMFRDKKGDRWFDHYYGASERIR